MDAEEKPAETDNMEERILSAKNETSVSSNSSQDTAPLGHPRDNTGYDNATDEWDEYPPYINADGLEIGSPDVYNDNPSLVFHAGYGYSPQMPYGPYSPVTTPLPSVGGDAHLYSPQQFPLSGPPSYQHLVSQPEFNTLANIDQQGDNMLCGPRPSYPPPMGSINGGSFPGNHSFHDLQHGFDGLRSGGLCSAWSKLSDRNRPLPPFSPAVSPQPIGTFGSFGQNVGMSGYNQGSSFGSASISSLGTNSQGWLSLENSRLRGRSSIYLCGCNSSLDILSEQNRGPRASKSKAQNIADHGPFVDDNKHSKPSAKIHDESYNQSDFVTEYKDAKFFIIKSYSEDNVHKSIKYGVWASTPNGNRKLDTAYSEAKDKQDPCPVFLLFSVNASAQFCGVSEMVGPVDFDKSVDYWQQDKWSGQFPVKWHIIKDVPNSQFRHIVLENNDNKPVKLKHGVEMLNIFKNYESDTSIVDYFDFYEDRQKAMQDRKARQEASLMAVGVGGESEHRNAVTLPTDIIKQMSKSFAQVIRLYESSKEGIVTDRASSGCDGSVGIRVKLEDVRYISELIGVRLLSENSYVETLVDILHLQSHGNDVTQQSCRMQSALVTSMCSVADDKKVADYVVFKQSKISLEPLLASASATEIASSNSRISEIVSVADLKFLIENLDEKLSENEKWENVTNKRNNLLAYTAKCFKPKDAPIKYLSLTVFENCTIEVLRDFYMDNEYRKQWDKTVVEHEQLQVDRTNGTEIGCTVKKFPLLTPREYVLAWRLWEGKDKTFYCFIKECEHPLAVRQRKFVRVKFFRSGWRISKVPGRNACQIKMFHQEDAGLNLEMAKLAFSRGIWSYVCKMNDALRRYSVMSHPLICPAVTAVSLIQKVPPGLETMNTVVDTQATSTSIASQGLDTGEAKEKKFLRRPSKKIVANGLLLLGGVIFLSRGHSSLGAKVALASILTKLRKHDALSGQERER
ncbi:hypothetical protein SADUNF_Sadunf14G0000800 [Salix dunnii]|uniref:YTH domain-containing protein n=1 Tax=Salix dunnii TaxID=1413687 RepID=A0A835JEX2_9ROSI|nr:hypothetical protein SADUNF_Sadunf14G0000800 [Salix dunnii]